MASGRPGKSSCFRRQSSRSFAISGWTRTITGSPVTIGRSFRDFVVSRVDLAMESWYHESKPRGSCHFRPGSNPSHKETESNDPG
jgi:hypothetical protein